MSVRFDAETGLLVGGVVAVLMLASVTGWILARRTGNAEYRSTIANLNARMRAWWIMVAIFLLAMVSSGIGSVVLFGLTSFLALREFVTMTPTKARRPRHAALGLLHHYANPIRAGCLWLVWAFLDFHSGLRVSLCSATQRPGRRLRALSGTDRNDPMGADGLCLLRESCSGADDVADSWI